MKFSFIVSSLMIHLFTFSAYSEVSNRAASCLDLKDPNGVTHNLCDKNGKKFIIMEFFLPSCGACQANVSQYKKLEEQTKDFAHSRLVSLGTEQRTLVFITQNNIRTEVLLGRDSQAGNAYGITNVPSLVVIDEHNQIIHRYIGVLDEPQINQIKNLVSMSK